MSSTDRSLPIRAIFANRDPDLAYRVIGGLLDMTLTQLGATIDDLETAYLSIGEVVAAISSGGSIAAASLEVCSNCATLQIEHTAPEIRFEPGSRELAEVAFPDFEVEDGLITVCAGIPSRPDGP